MLSMFAVFSMSSMSSDYKLRCEMLCGVTVTWIDSCTLTHTQGSSHLATHARLYQTPSESIRTTPITVCSFPCLCKETRLG